MAQALRDLLAGGPSAWAALGRRQQVLAVAVAVLVPVLIFVGSQWFLDGQYVPLFASLNAEEAGTIIAQLKASKTPYRIGGSGEQILVPADKASEVRLRLAGQGLPLGGGVGFEVFDRTAFGMSDFAQRLNFQRALQGELARTIGQLREVSRARVHLVMPQPSLFTDRDRPASAAVFLKLVPSGRLTPEQVRGIVHLVASSVEGLSPDRITVVDTAGRVLSVGAEPGAGQLSPRRLEMKAGIEEGLERRVQSLLDSALGPGQAVTRVSVQLNFDQVERTEERFDPGAVIRRETRTVENSRGSASNPIVPAVVQSPPGTPPPPGQASVTNNEGNRESESVDYEVSKVVARTLTTPGDVQRLSVAVLLNTAARAPQGSGKPEARPPVARPPEEIEKLRRIVMGAVGYAQARGDEVTVVEMPFDTALADRERALLEAEPQSRRPQWLTPQTFVIAAAALVVAVVLAVWLARRKARRRELGAVARSLQITGTAGGGAAVDRATRAVSEAAPASLLEAPPEFVRIASERKNLRERVFALATTEPEATAQLLRAWLVKKKPVPAVRGERDG